jgi:flagellar assembly protein FliH
MTSTSSEPVVLRDLPANVVGETRPSADLRQGHWTRLGSRGVLGDAVTEATLASLADQARDAARAQGYAAGWAQGRRAALEGAAAAESERAARHCAELAALAAEQRTAAAALAAAIDSCNARVQTTCEELAAHAVRLGLAVAEAILMREVSVSADPGADALRRAMTQVPAAVPVTVRLHPEDRSQLDVSMLEGREVSFVDDPSMQRGGAVVETEHGVVDATVDAALARVREVLTR